jgi:hypothetical protein
LPSRPSLEFRLATLIPLCRWHRPERCFCLSLLRLLLNVLAVSWHRVVGAPLGSGLDAKPSSNHPDGFILKSIDASPTVHVTRGELKLRDGSVTLRVLHHSKWESLHRAEPRAIFNRRGQVKSVRDGVRCCDGSARWMHRRICPLLVCVCSFTFSFHRLCFGLGQRPGWRHLRPRVPPVLHASAQSKPSPFRMSRTCPLRLVLFKGRISSNVSVHYICCSHQPASTSARKSHPADPS